ncbi:MAG: inositol monophosphatase [Candidatus Omnitrophica bacterium]|nr:inositol monophosphatase [Candidatus Omnitrophota bacterium]
MNYLDIAKMAARKAGTVHKKYFNKDLKIRTKSASYDLLTVADTQAESTAVRVIRKYFPGHNILGEEASYVRTDSEYTWVIDPLDGTSNFASGLPIFCASVALVNKGVVAAGAIYDVTRDELFYAERGKGAFLNGKAIHVNRAASLKQALLITGFYYSRGTEMVRTLKEIERFQHERIRGIRRLGAAALDLCYVACGRAAGFWEFELSPWDFCAGKLLVEEAGGRITDQFGSRLNPYKKSFIVASNKKIHSSMLKVLNYR